MLEAAGGGVTDLDFRSIFDSSHEPMLVVDAAYDIAYANPSFGALVGVPPQDLLGRAVSSVIHEDDLALTPLKFDVARRHGAVVTVRRLRATDGRTPNVEVVTTLLPSGGYLCSVRDIDHRPEVDALRDSEARFRTLAANLNAGLVMTDAADRITYANGRMEEYTGCTLPELIGQTLAALLPADATPLHEVLRSDAPVNGICHTYLARHSRKDGSPFVGEVCASPLTTGNGDFAGTVAVVIDVTSRLQREREQRESERRYRLLFEVTPLPAWVYDVETLRFLAVNPAAVAHYGYSEAEFLAMTIGGIRPLGDPERFNQYVHAEHGHDRARGFKHRKRDGTLLDVEIVSHAFEFEGRRARIAVVNDITEQIRTLERQHEVEERLLLAQKMDAVGLLAGGVAHDFNNLLSVVLGAAEVLQNELTEESGVLEEVGDIKAAVSRGAALTRQLLAFGRKEVHAPGLVDLNEVMTNVERLLARVLGKHIRIELQKGVHTAPVVADTSQMEQVIVNLAINARDAMPRGGVLTIATGVAQVDAIAARTLGVVEGSYVTLAVADTGIGMDLDTRTRAFEPFFTTKAPTQGSGLGLSTVYGIARQSGGTVTIDSVPGKGTCVRLHLPRSSAGARLHSPTPTRGMAIHGRGRILLVEDEPRVRAQARRLLERSGFTVIEAADGEQGEREFRAHGGTIDAVVTDIVMPGLGGVELVSRIREIAPAVPVVFVSGFTAEDRDLPLDERTQFVPKPYSIASLCDAITAVTAV